MFAVNNEIYYYYFPPTELTHKPFYSLFCVLIFFLAKVQR